MKNTPSLCFRDFTNNRLSLKGIYLKAGWSFDKKKSSVLLFFSVTGVCFGKFEHFVGL